MAKLRSKTLIALLALVLAVTALIAGTAASAQSTSDVEARDQLIAAQENLLNAYRCLYDTDTDLVAGGCADPATVTPGPAPPEPTLQDLDVRDQLIANQEALPNVYRCQFDVDTQLVPDGCPQSPTNEPEPASDPLVQPWDETFKTGWTQLIALTANCEWDGTFFTCGNNTTEDQITQIATTTYGCDQPFNRTFVAHILTTYGPTNLMGCPGGGNVLVWPSGFSDDIPISPPTWSTIGTGACPGGWLTLPSPSFICLHPDHPANPF